jgi:DNA-binding NarL/FixJ family response regulator
MDDCHREGEVRSLRDSNSPEPISAAGAAAYRFEAPEGAGPVPSGSAQHWRPVKEPTVSIAVVDEHSFTRDCISKSLQQSGEVLAVSAFATCESCVESAGTYDLVLFHAHGAMTDRKHGGAGRTAPFDKLLGITPVVVLSDVDCPEAVLDAFESGVRGYIPTTDTTLGLLLEIVRLVRAGGTFVPPSGLPLRRTGRRDLSSPSEHVAAEHFTPRQMAVLHHLKLGKANKSIARELEMSESTVKIHLRNIMKKMRAANRTEVACRAHALDGTRLGVTADRA